MTCALEILKASSQPASIAITFHAIDPATAEWREAPEWSSQFTLATGERILEYGLYGSGAADIKVKNGYDDQGRLLATTVQSARGAPRVIKYRYDLHTEGSESAVRPELGALGLYSELGSDDLALNPFIRGAALVAVGEDEHKQRTYLQAYDSRRQPLGRMELTYDDQGHLLRESLSLAAAREILPRTHEFAAPFGELASMGKAALEREVQFAYDSAGRCSELSQRGGGFELGRSVRQYNDHGDVCQQANYSPEPLGIDVGLLRDKSLAAVVGSLPARPLRLASEITYSYEYDQHGSWTTRIAERQNQPGRRVRIPARLTRQITYP